MGSFDWPEDVRAIHARVCAALEPHGADAIAGAFAAGASLFVKRGDDFDRIEAIFRGPELSRAIASGWSKMDPLMTARLPGLALAALARLDGPAARAIAADAAKLAATEPAAKRVVEPLVAEANALSMLVDSVEAVEKALAAMRAAIPDRAHYLLHGTLADHPAVRVLRDAKSELVQVATRRALALLVDDGRILSEPDQVYAYALTLVLEVAATADDRVRLFEIWTDSVGFMLLDHHRVLRHGDEGQAFMASLYGRNSRSQYAAQEQVLAARAKLAIDAATTLEVTRRLVAKARSHAHEFAVSGLFETLREGEPMPEWIELLEACGAQPGDAGRSALATLVRWRQPNAAAVVLARIADGTLDVERGCALLEAAKDASVCDGLERYAASLGKNTRREKNRIAKCLRALRG